MLEKWRSANSSVPHFLSQENSNHETFTMTADKVSEIWINEPASAPGENIMRRNVVFGCTDDVITAVDEVM